MHDHYNLTQGSILTKLIKVSLPVIGTSFVQMAYTLTDVFWLGKISNEALAAGGFGGFFTWLGVAIFILVKIGTEVRVAQKTGNKEHEEAKGYAKTGVQVEIILALMFSIILLVFANFWIGLFNINPDQIQVEKAAITYLQIIAIGMPFYLMNPVLSGSLNGTGNTKIPFIISVIGIILNMGLDPLFMFGFKLDVLGAALATIISQFVVTLVFIYYFKTKDTILSHVKLFSRIDVHKAKDILKLGMPAAIQSAIFTFIAMYLASLIAPLDINANAVQKVGSNIESLSWLTAGGISTGLGTFVGQNYGAGQYKRVLKGIKYALLTMSIYGIFVSLLLYFLPGPLFSIFSSKPKTLPMGIDYLQILAFSQLFMILEATVGGAFNGLGKTRPASIVSIAFNFARIPMAMFFMERYGLNGMWLSITISSILKGLVLYIWFKLYIRKNPHFNHLEELKD